MKKQISKPISSTYFYEVLAPLLLGVVQLDGLLFVGWILKVRSEHLQVIFLCGFVNVLLFPETDFNVFQLIFDDGLVLIVQVEENTSWYQWTKVLESLG